MLLVFICSTQAEFISMEGLAALSGVELELRKH
jgi:hypothetical protein